MRFTHTLWSAFALSIAITCTAAFADDVTAQGEPYTFRDEPTSQPSAGGPSVEGGLVEYLANRFSPHEPIYFLYGPDDPHVKFQISLKYQIFSPQGALQKAVPTVSGLYFAYTQQSFWDTGADSGPFFDSSYKPEFLWLTQFRNPDWIPGLSRFDLQAGLQHESNGKGGDDSRSLNIAYIRPIFTFGDWEHERGFFTTFAPRLWTYVGDLEDNPDLANYRGYGDVKLIMGWRYDLQFSATARFGDEWDKIGLELNLSYPIGRFTGRSVDMYLYAQYYTGYGESLIGYDENGDSFRIGLALVR
jgi:outer membrane phospholipase A